jgi:hypothetical protein
MHLNRNQSIRKTRKGGEKLTGSNGCLLAGKGKPSKGGVNSPLIQVFFK